VTVNGALVPDHSQSTVAQALRAAGITPEPGHYRSVIRHRDLGTDGVEPTVLVDGRAATLSSLVRPGDSIRVQPAPDRVEPIETVTVPVVAPVPSALYVGGRPGADRVRRGALSHEVLSRRVVRVPVAGHLVRRGAVALTFDDGPSSVWTPRILRLLDRRHVKATFCMIGQQAASHPAVVRRVVRAGHALCNHTWDHDLALATRPRPQVDLDVRMGSRAILRASHGRRPLFFRAPGGHWSRAITAAAAAGGMAPLRWTVDPRDWSRPGTAAIVRTVLAELRPGGVILMHDGGGNRDETYAALRILLHRLPRMGYHFVLPPAG
jgi:peptidoglycan/xylan/chitin deacetylase (PgdA/CDA1 family)